MYSIKRHDFAYVYTIIGIRTCLHEYKQNAIYELINFMEQSPSWEADSSSYSKKFSTFQGTECSLPCSQKPIHFDYARPDESS